jgi:hypothetical protein
MAVKNRDIANWGYINGVHEEYLKLTFNFKTFPWVFMLKGDTLYSYRNMLDEYLIVEYIKSDHKQTKLKLPIPPALTYLGLQYIYLKGKYPAWNNTMNNLAFNRLGLESLPF